MSDDKKTMLTEAEVLEKLEYAYRGCDISPFGWGVRYALHLVLLQDEHARNAKLQGTKYEPGSRNKPADVILCPLNDCIINLNNFHRVMDICRDCQKNKNKR